MMIITSPENLKKLDRYKEISARLAHAEGLTDEQAHALAREGKAVVWIDGGLHASEVLGSHQLLEHVWQMASLNDPETLRFLDDVIQLVVQVNPDGQELVAGWFGWLNRTLESTAEKADIPMLWFQWAHRGYLTLKELDTALLEPRLPPAIFYNLLVSARSPATARSAGEAAYAVTASAD